jgi:esterase/lipase
MFKNILENFVFNPDKDLKTKPSDFNMSYEDIFLSNSNSSTSSIFYKYHGWYIENTSNFNIELSKYVILYFHGNAGNISTRIHFLNKLYLLGFSLLIFDYPGFGLSEGIPNEESCLEVSNLFYEYLHENKKYSRKNIVFYGESIGGCIASSLAVKTKIKYLILHSTFVNITSVIKQFFYIPKIVLEQIGFDTLYSLKKRQQLNILFFNKNKEKNSEENVEEENYLIIKNFKLKTLIIHSKNDELIPFNHAIELSKYCTHFYECEGKHSSPKINKEFLDQIIQFIL